MKAVKNLIHEDIPGRFSSLAPPPCVRQAVPSTMRHGHLWVHQWISVVQVPATKTEMYRTVRSDWVWFLCPFGSPVWKQHTTAVLLSSAAKMGTFMLGPSLTNKISPGWRHRFPPMARFSIWFYSNAPNNLAISWYSDILISLIFGQISLIFGQAQGLKTS